MNTAALMLSRVRDRVPSIPRPDGGLVRMYVFIGAALLLSMLSLSGIIAGVGAVLIALVSLKVLLLIEASILLGFSTGTFALLYMWFTG